MKLRKSKTQMTKAELIELLKEKEAIITDLETEIESHNKERIALDAIELGQETSELIIALNSKIRQLEQQLDNGTTTE
jgi:hypothetical protein